MEELRKIPFEVIVSPGTLPVVDGVRLYSKRSIVNAFYKVLYSVGYTFDVKERPVPGCIVNWHSMSRAFLVTMFTNLYFSMSRYLDAFGNVFDGYFVDGSCCLVPVYDSMLRSVEFSYEDSDGKPVRRSLVCKVSSIPKLVNDFFTRKGYFIRRIVITVFLCLVVFFFSSCRAIVVADKLVYQGTLMHRHAEKLMVDTAFTIQLPSVEELEK